MLLSRREMLELSAKAGLGSFVCAALGGAAGFLCPEAEAADHKALFEALFYEKLGDGSVHCQLCPRSVTLPKDRTCYCKTRKNVDGRLAALGFKKACAVNPDEIERGPLYHFLPGTKTLAMAAAGCNMDCLYCQNYELAQSAPDRVKSVDFDPARALGGHQFKTLTFTYTDAICQPEYVFELSKIARKYGVKTVLCTGAYVNPGPLAEFVKRVDAFAVTLKASDEASYKSLTGVRLAPVLDAIRQIKESGRWLELITLIVPGYNDELKGLAWLANWIRSELGADTPWHLSRFVPEYKLRKLPPTPRRTLEDARKAGLEAGLKYVYITNLAPHEGNNTYCPKCGKAVLERLGFKLMAKKLSSDGKCPFCGASLPGVWS